jgi:hypothetical protein
VCPRCKSPYWNRPRQRGGRHMSDWLNNELDGLFASDVQQSEPDAEDCHDGEAKAYEFLSAVVVPAFLELKEALEPRGRTVAIQPSTLTPSDTGAGIEVSYGGTEEFRLVIKTRISHNTAFPFPVEDVTDKKDGRYAAEGYLRRGTQDYRREDVTKDEIIQYFLQAYRRSITYPS